jgi:hypothetical protein
VAASRDTSSGPDWLDCRVLMREMNTALEARVELTITPVLKGSLEQMMVKATAYPYLSVVADQRQSVSLSAAIPGSSPVTGTAAIFRLLLALDYEVSKAWATKQAT